MLQRAMAKENATSIIEIAYLSPSGLSFRKNTGICISKIDIEDLLQTYYKNLSSTIKLTSSNQQGFSEIKNSIVRRVVEIEACYICLDYSQMLSLLQNLETVSYRSGLIGISALVKELVTFTRAQNKTSFQRCLAVLRDSAEYLYFSSR